MANKLGSLVVSLGLDAAEFTRGMSKSEYEAKQRSDAIKAQFAKIATAVAGLGVGAAFTGLVRNTALASREIERFAQLSNTSTERFQEAAYAADRYGISQEKLADIFKDVQDKVGDFLQNGAGPLKDFFDNVAPQVGVTADQFRRLSGPEALQLYVSSLQKANLSQAEMTFYMEAIASDSALLTPLLKDNGAELKNLGDQARRYGVIMSSEAVEAGRRFADNMDELQAKASGFGIALASEVLPKLNDVASAFLSAETGGNSFARFLGGGLNTALEATSVLAANVAFVLNTLGDTAGAYAAVSAALIRGDVAGAKAIGQAYREMSAERRKALDDFERRVMRPVRFGADDQSSAEARRLGLTGPTPTPARPRVGGATPRRTGTQAGAGREAFNGLSYDEQVTQRVASLLENSAVTKGKEYADVLAKLDSLYFDGAISGELYESSLLKLTGATAEGTAQASLFIQEQQRLAELLGATESAGIDRQREDMDLLARAFADGVIAEQQYLEAVTARLNLVADKTGEVKSLTEELGLTFTSAFEDAIVGGKGLSDVIKGLEQDILRLVTRKMVTEPLGNALTSALGSFDFGSLFSFDGGGYTGGGARAGGMDGKGGFLALLHPNETVLDHTRGQRGGGGSTHHYNINVQVPPGASRSTGMQFGREVARQLSVANARNG